MPTRPSTKDTALDDITLAGLETQDHLVRIYREAAAAEKRLRSIRQLVEQAITTNDVRGPLDRLRSLTLVAPHGRAHGGAA